MKNKFKPFHQLHINLSQHFYYLIILYPMTSIYLFINFVLFFDKKKIFLYHLKPLIEKEKIYNIN